METTAMKTARIYEVKFNKPEFNAKYTFIRRESGAFAYGNRSAVDVYRNDEWKESLDTRYDRLVMKDFTAWCEEYLRNAFNPDYEPTWGMPMMEMPGLFQSLAKS
jgi:hypothetical protein